MNFMPTPDRTLDEVRESASLGKNVASRRMAATIPFQMYELNYSKDCSIDVPIYFSIDILYKFYTLEIKEIFLVKIIALKCLRLNQKALIRRRNILTP